MFSQSRKRIFYGILGFFFMLALLLSLNFSFFNHPGVCYAEDTVKIGVLMPFPFVYSDQVVTAVEMAIDEVNDKGGVLGKKFEYIGREDTAFKLDQAVLGAKNFVRKGAYAVVGGFANQGVMATQPIFSRAKVFFFNCGSAGFQISEMLKKDWENRKYWFRVSLNNSYFQGLDFVDAATSIMKDTFGFSKVAMMPEDATWNEAYDAVAQKEFPKRGIEIAYQTRVPIDTKDFTPILSKIMKTDAEFITIVFSHNDGVQFARQWYDKKIPLPVFGVSSSAEMPKYWQMTNGKTYSHFIGKFAFDDEVAVTPKTIPFSLKFIEKFGSGPLYAAYGGYDAVHILAEAIERAKTLDREKVLEEVEKTSWVGPIGRIEFYGKNAKFPHDVKAVSDGFEEGVQLRWGQWFKEKAKCVWPNKFRTAEPFLPEWIKPKK